MSSDDEYVDMSKYVLYYIRMESQGKDDEGKSINLIHLIENKVMVKNKKNEDVPIPVAPIKNIKALKEDVNNFNEKGFEYFAYMIHQDKPEDIKKMVKTYPDGFFSPPQYKHFEHNFYNKN